MSGADWLAQLCAHIPDRFEHLVRYAGCYSMGLWAPQLGRGRQPGQPAHGPPVPSTPVLAYHPVPDIA